MSRPVIRIGLALLALAAAGTALAAKPRVPQWTGAAALAPRASAPQTGVDGAGNAVVVWADLGNTGFVGAARGAFAKGWSTAPVAPAEGRFRRAGELAVGASGDAVLLAAVTRQACNDYRENCHRTVQAISRPPSGAWSAAVDVSDSAFDAFLHGGGGDAPSVAVDGSGGAVAAWISWDGAENSLVAATRSRRADAWSAPFTLWASRLTFVETAANATGSALVAFATYDGKQSVIRAVRRPGATAAWLAPDVLGSGLVSTLTQAEAAPDGRALVAWCTYRGMNASSLFQAALFDGRAWVTAELPMAGDCGSSKPTLALQPGGSVLAVWRTSERKVVAASGAPDLRTWSQPVTVSEWRGSAEAESPVVAGGPAGHVLVSWQRGYSLRARRWDPQTKRWSPSSVVDEYRWITSTSAVVDAQGRAVVAWLRTSDFRGTEGELRARTLVFSAKKQ